MRDWNLKYSLIRMLHAVPEGDRVDIYINNMPFYKNLAFTEFSPYVYVPEGNYTVTVYPIDTQENPIINEKIDVKVGELVTIAISGSENDVKLIPVVEEAEVVGGNNAKIRVVHLVPNGPSVNIEVNGQKLYSNVEFREVTPYVTVLAGEYVVNVEESEEGKIILKNKVILNAGRIYTFYAVGNLPNAEVIQSLDGATFMS